MLLLRPLAQDGDVYVFVPTKFMPRRRRLWFHVKTHGCTNASFWWSSSVSDYQNNRQTANGGNMLLAGERHCTIALVLCCSSAALLPTITRPGPLTATNFRRLGQRQQSARGHLTAAAAEATARARQKNWGFYGIYLKSLCLRGWRMYKIFK